MKTRADVVLTIEKLIENLKNHPEEWENTELMRYLEAMSAWIDSSRMREVQEPSWDLFCDALKAAKVYE